jgi:hypothetical protein
MADLSPAALAVWEAFNSEEPGVFVDYGDCVAAALRAAATQLHHDPKQSHQIGGIIASRSQLLAIAAELDNTPQQS